MFGLSLKYKVQHVFDAFRDLSDAITGNTIASGSLLRRIGHLVVKQTDVRIEREKKDPEGSQWEEWSARYAKTRHSNHSLLISTGQLQRSFAFSVSGNEVAIGTSNEYAKFHQTGTPKMPERAFLGLSDRNQKEIVFDVQHFLLGKLAGAKNA